MKTALVCLSLVYILNILGFGLVLSFFDSLSTIQGVGYLCNVKLIWCYIGRHQGCRVELIGTTGATDVAPDKLDEALSSR